MKVGDTIRRKDMPNIQCKIVGKSRKWENYWKVALLHKINGVEVKVGLLDMNDDRWEVVE